MYSFGAKTLNTHISFVQIKLFNFPQWMKRVKECEDEKKIFVQKY